MRRRSTLKPTSAGIYYRKQTQGDLQGPSLLNLRLWTAQFPRHFWVTGKFPRSHLLCLEQGWPCSSKLGPPTPKSKTMKWEMEKLFKEGKEWRGRRKQELPPLPAQALQLVPSPGQQAAPCEFPPGCVCIWFCFYPAVPLPVLAVTWLCDLRQARCPLWPRVLLCVITRL